VRSLPRDSKIRFTNRVSVDFDLELGPTVVSVFPSLILSHAERENVYVRSPRFPAAPTYPSFEARFRRSPTPPSSTKGRRHIPSVFERPITQRMIPFVTIVLGPCPMTGSFTAILTLPKRKTGSPSVATNKWVVFYHLDDVLTQEITEIPCTTIQIPIPHVIHRIDLHARSCISNSWGAHARSGVP